MKEEINFCEFSPEKLTLLLDYLGKLEILEQSKCVSKYEDDKCIEKKWEYYEDILVIYPKKITSSHHLTIELINDEKYLKIKKVIEWDKM